MTTNATIADLDLTPNALPIVSETSKLKLTSWLERCEEMLRKAFGEDEETIANSIRGF